jgi:hypothetical protein
MVETLVATPSTHTNWRRHAEVNWRGLAGAAPTGPDKATLTWTPATTKYRNKGNCETAAVYFIALIFRMNMNYILLQQTTNNVTYLLYRIQVALHWPLGDRQLPKPAFAGEDRVAQPVTIDHRHCAVPPC